MADNGNDSGLSIDVQYVNDDEDCDPPSRQFVRETLAAALPAQAQVTVRFTGRAESHAANLRLRGKDKPTNVLSFSYPGKFLSGDISICPAVVEDEARDAKIKHTVRYAHLLVHAALHLQGMDHHDADDAAAMEKVEAKVLAKLGFANPYQDA